MLHFFLKRKRFFFFFLLSILCVALITVGVDKKQKQLPAETALQTFFSYPLSLTSWISNTTSSLWAGYIHLVDVKKRNIALQQEIGLLLLENQQLREHFIENQRLKTLLDFKQQFSYTMLPAEIIGRDPSSWFKTILVNRGTEAGVQLGSGVISPLGAVGTVIETTLYSSKILLITDQNSAIDSIAQRSRVRGILEGQAENACTMNYVVKSEDIQTGDVLIASGLNAVFPRGIIIGRVTETDNTLEGFFKNISVVPAVDFSKLNEVLIVLKKQTATHEKK